MPKLLKITCDACGNDLTETTNSEGYRIVLKSESMPSVAGLVTDVAAYPDFEEPKHFCGMKCLRNWARTNL